MRKTSKISNTTRCTLYNLGNIYYCLKDYKKAIELHQQSLNLAKEMGSRLEEGIASGALGLAFYSIGNERQALQYHQQALDIAREIGHLNGESAACGNLGVVFLDLRDIKRAIEYSQRQLALFYHEQGLHHTKSDCHNPFIRIHSIPYYINNFAYQNKSGMVTGFNITSSLIRGSISKLSIISNPLEYLN